MRCPSLFLCFPAIASSALSMWAQTTDTNAPAPKIWSLSKADANSPFLKNFTIESFGFNLAPQAPGFQFSPGYTSTFYNLHGLECPACVSGPQDRAGRFTLPPFGAKATLKLDDGRSQLFSGFAAPEAWKPDGTFEPRGHSLFSSSYGDAWLAQTET